MAPPQALHALSCDDGWVALEVEGHSVSEFSHEGFTARAEAVFAFYLG